MRLRVRSITYLAQRINGYELVDPEEHDLPAFEAGAHLSVRAGGSGRCGTSRCGTTRPSGRAIALPYCASPRGAAPANGMNSVRVGDIVEASGAAQQFPALG